MNYRIFLQKHPSATSNYLKATRTQAQVGGRSCRWPGSRPVELLSLLPVELLPLLHLNLQILPCCRLLLPHRSCPHSKNEPVSSPSDSGVRTGARRRRTSSVLPEHIRSSALPIPTPSLSHACWEAPDRRNRYRLLPFRPPNLHTSSTPSLLLWFPRAAQQLQGDLRVLQVTFPLSIGCWFAWPWWSAACCHWSSSVAPPVTKNRRRCHWSITHARVRARSPTLHACRWSSCSC